MPIRDDAYFVRCALRQAELALREDVFPVGAVVVVGGEIVAACRRTEGRLNHAEMNALQKVLADYHEMRHEMTVYSTLEPCLMCASAIRISRAWRLVYALEDPFGGGTRVSDEELPECYRNSLIIREGVLRKESKQLFRRYFETTKDDFWVSNPQNPFARMVLGEN